MASLAIYIGAGIPGICSSAKGQRAILSASYSVKLWSPYSIGAITEAIKTKWQALPVASVLLCPFGQLDESSSGHPMALCCGAVALPFPAERIRYNIRMSVKEIEAAITQLPVRDVTELMSWLAEHHAEVWDKQIEYDLDSGKLDALLAEVDQEYEAGLAKPL